MYAHIPNFLVAIQNKSLNDFIFLNLAIERYREIEGMKQNIQRIKEYNDFYASKNNNRIILNELYFTYQFTSSGSLVFYSN